MLSPMEYLTIQFILEHRCEETRRIQETALVALFENLSSEQTQSFGPRLIEDLLKVGRMMGEARKLGGEI